MVLIRYGDENKTRRYQQMLYFEDSVWSMVRDAGIRADRLETAGYYAFVKEIAVNDVTQYVVWRSKAKRTGSKHGKSIKDMTMNRSRK